MDNNAIWIVVAVVAVIVIVALLLAARKRRNQRRHVEAKQIREDLTSHVAKVDKREALADETAARARAAEAEAQAKAAEAARLKDQADSHRGVVAESREEIEERRRHADRIDPKTKVRDDADDSHGVKHDDAARDSAAQRDAAAQHDATRRDAPRR